MDKLKLLLASRKFWAAFIGLVLIIIKAYRPDFPLTDTQATGLVYVLVAYILGTAIEDGAANINTSPLVVTIPLAGTIPSNASIPIVTGEVITTSPAGTTPEEAAKVNIANPAGTTVPAGTITPLNIPLAGTDSTPTEAASDQL